MIQPYPVTVGLRQLRVTKCMFIYYVDNLCHNDMGLGLFISPLKLLKNNPIKVKNPFFTPNQNTYKWKYLDMNQNKIQTHHNLIKDGICEEKK